MKKLPKINKKKADLSVIAFVFLVLLVTGYSLFVIASHKTKVERQITGFEQTEEWLREKKDLEYRLLKLTEQCLIKSYREIVNQNLYMQQPVEITDPEGNPLKIYTGENPHLQQNFSDKLKNCIFSKPEKIKNRENIKIDFQENQIIFSLENYPVYKQENQNKQFVTEIKTELRLLNYQLLPFENIKEIVNCNLNQECEKKYSEPWFTTGSQLVESNEKSATIYIIESKQNTHNPKIIFEFIVLN